MQYQNRQPAEGLNVTRHNAFLHFLKLMAMALLVIVILVVVLNLLGASLAKRIPFRYETALMNRVDFDFGLNRPVELVNYLNRLSERLSTHMPAQDEVQYTVHYSAEDVFNAYATLGGNLVFYRELLRQMPNENALAMVMAHEMSHVLHRDPLAGLGGGTASMAALMMLTGTSVFSGSIFNQTGALTQLTFNRDMETAADRIGLQAVVGLYGHVVGADTLFRLLSGNDSAETSSAGASKLKEWLQEFAQTHPLDQNRIKLIDQLAVDQGWNTNGQVTPLPTDFHRWLSDSP